MTTTTNSQKQNTAAAASGTGKLSRLASRVALATVAVMAVSTTGCFGVTGGYSLGFSDSRSR